METRSELITREEALSVLNQGYQTVFARLLRTSPEEAARPGLGGGDWSAKDLLGHLTSWEGYAVLALEAWRQGLPAEIDTALRDQGLDGVNARAIEEKRELRYDEVRQAYHATHAELVRLMEDIPDDIWRSPPTKRATRPVGESLGRILGGNSLFDHADAHLPDLMDWLERPR